MQIFMILHYILHQFCTLQMVGHQECIYIFLFFCQWARVNPGLTRLARGRARAKLREDLEQDRIRIDVSAYNRKLQTVPSDRRSDLYRGNLHVRISSLGRDGHYTAGPSIEETL